jgi:hypothetical protein
MLNLYFEILSKPRAELTMIDQMIVALPFMILLLIFLVYLWIKEQK